MILLFSPRKHSKLPLRASFLLLGLLETVWRNRISTTSTRRYNNEMHYHHNSDMSLNK